MLGRLRNLLQVHPATVRLPSGARTAAAPAQQRGRGLYFMRLGLSLMSHGRHAGPADKLPARVGMRMSGYELELIVKHQAMQLQMTDPVSRLCAHPCSPLPAVLMLILRLAPSSGSLLHSPLVASVLLRCVMTSTTTSGS